MQRRRWRSALLGVRMHEFPRVNSTPNDEVAACVGDEEARHAFA